MVVNGYAGSGGDLFPWEFSQAHLGPLIGKRTCGKLIGISGSGADIVDGGFYSTPAAANYDVRTFEIIAENRGISPDIDVDARPDLIALGKDPQLEVATKYLVEQLAKHPRRQPDSGVPHLPPPR